MGDGTGPVNDRGPASIVYSAVISREANSLVFRLFRSRLAQRINVRPRPPWARRLPPPVLALRHYAPPRSTKTDPFALMGWSLKGTHVGDEKGRVLLPMGDGYCTEPGPKQRCRRRLYIEHMPLKAVGLDRVPSWRQVPLVQSPTTSGRFLPYSLRRSQRGSIWMAKGMQIYCALQSTPK